MEKINLWEQVSNRCLKCAIRALDGETTPTAATVEVVKALVETACMIDTLNLRWEQQKSISIPAFCEEGDFSGEATP